MIRNVRPWRIPLAVVLTIGAVGAGWAHGLRVVAAPQADGIAGRAFYSDETPATGETVLLFDAGGARLATTQTVDDGRFVFALSRHGEYLVVAEGEEGHRAETRVRVGPLPPSAASPVAALDDARLAALIRGELQPLREDIARYEKRIRLQNIVAGLGFIVGLAGAWVWWRARRGGG
ncbi:carboxypeptidase regulatory-like domain-containing protein [Sinimarinibacterium flocculans]|uniref:Nickel transport protein n=1 Tax=Sinimarinibacterium flocculans TaxID=985250 RepID=A0A318E8Q8_9GAMM|nr:carboxypeptidase regulatory-like domain-containing protein [Sinimarinibacterium flocculans]PXV65680.1 nickel transport protein [Sinimarinibacterium flocculans]